MKPKNYLFSKLITIALIFFFSTNSFAQIDSNMTKLLVQKNIITQREADSLLVLENNAKTRSEAELNVNKPKSDDRIFALGLEFRPRGEYRDGYKQLPADSSESAYFVSQRSRLNFSYEQPKFKFYTSIQDVRVWGQYGQNSTTGSLNVFEAFASLEVMKNFWVKMGRQKIELDNGRLFAASNWNQYGRAHDGIDLIYKNKTIETELFTAFNQTGENIFGTDYSPTAFVNYKLLNVHYLRAKLNDNFTLTTLNSADSFESKTNATTLYTRGTSGGRVEFEKNNLYLTFSAYYQYGHLQSGVPISAYYFQPEIRYKIQKWTARLGMEYMSGDDGTQVSTTSNSFIPLYGVAWRFMGNMDYFTNFPKDVHNGGLVNPYLFCYYDWTEKLTLRSDFHLFYSENKILNAQKNVNNSYLGYENDLSIRYKYNGFTTVDFGFSYMLAEKSMETIKGGNSDITPIWSYLMITFKPELFNSRK
jgi:hypothetical protein